MIDEAALRDLNKWTKSGSIPDDRTYVVLLPVEGNANPSVTSPVAAADTQPVTDRRITPAPTVARAKTGKINGVRTIEALPGDNARSLAAKARVDYPKFIRYNDLKNGDAIIPGQVYFLSRKRLKGSEDFHKVSPGESLWTISQRYGIQMKRLRKYNRLDDHDDPAPGTMLFLASKRPKTDEVIAKVEDPVEVSNQETFSWAVKTESAPEAVLTTEPVVIAPSADNAAVIPATPTNGADSSKILQTNKTVATFEEDSVTDVSAVVLPANLQHRVKAGETLYGIAKRYKLAVMDIVTWNDLNLQEGIKPGQVLKLTDGNEPEPTAQKEVKTITEGEFFHEVRTSDTLYSIARQYNVTIQQIMEWNEKKDFSLAVGERLKIQRR
jgi:membrane-bound lytic murein transglycosylase D